MNNNTENFKPESRSRKFWRVVLGSMVGFVLSSMIVFILGILSIITMIASVERLSSSSSAATLKDNSVLLVNLTAPIEERAIEIPFDFGEYSQQTMGLDKILESIKSAAGDPKIKGIYLKSSTVSASPAPTKAIRDAIKQFKKSGKFVYSYSDIYTQNGYYLASVADKVFLNPTGDLTIKGVSFQVMFYKNLFDKMDVDVQILRHGQFKSAVEPYFLDKMSEANRNQMSTLANSLWGVFLDEVSKARKISIEDLNNIADNLLCSSPQKALEFHLVDDLVYADEAENTIKHKLNLASSDKINFVTISKYSKSLTDKQSNSDKVAVVYAYGSISDGSGPNERGIFSETFIKDFRKAYKDKDVKAIVLRVNSPGGSALASENIWHEIEQAKKAGIKVVTSMGDYAASGGYYISCSSDYIFAQPNTITGSIGVFGMIPSIQKFLKNKIGITIDRVNSNKHSDFGGIFRPLDDVERDVIQNSIEEIYGLFTERVADGRNMTVSFVDSIGQGRVWAGIDAIQLGLVDELGSIDNAISKAAELAGISNYDVVYYPKQKDWFSMLFNIKNDVVEDAIRQELGQMYFLYEGVKSATENEGIQARMPYCLYISQ